MLSSGTVAFAVTNDNNDTSTNNNISDNASIIAYDISSFEQYSPVTLIDILQRIPGVPAILDKTDNRNNQQRGFGSSGDQILINGKRLSAKGSSIRDVLARTSASDVRRVELIRGAAAGLDVLTEGLVVNVVLNKDNQSSSTFWKIAGFYRVGYKLLPAFEISHKGSTGNLDYSVAIEGERRTSKFGRDEIQHDNNDNVVTGIRDVDGNWYHSELKFTNSLSYDFGDNQILNLNGLYNPNRNENEQYHIDREAGGEALYWDFGENFIEWEAAGDYSRNVDFLGNLKSRFVINRKHNRDNKTERYDGLGTDRYLYTIASSGFKSSEDIIRVSFTKKLSSSQSLEYGSEGAFNTFHQQYTSIERDEASDPLELATSNNIVIKENRYEVFAHHNYTITPKIVLQSSLTTEFSKITSDTILAADNIINVTNKFTFLKPRFNFKYDLTSRDQVRLTAEKKVSQLEFFHYITYFDQLTKELKFGNNDIKPAKTWEYSATYEHRLANDGGSLEGTIFYRDYRDYIVRSDFTEYKDFNGNPISADQYFSLPPDAALREDTDFTSKFGNVKKATGYGVEIKANYRLGIIGLKEALINAEYKYDKRRYNDPFTGKSRKFSWESDHRVKLSFRHDISSLGLSYGIKAEYVSPFKQADIDFDWQFRARNGYQIFVEKNITNDIKARIEYEKNGESNSKARFYNFVDHRRFNEPDGYDDYYFYFPTRIAFNLQGTF